MEIIENRRVTHSSTYGLAAFLFLTPFEYPLADLMSISPLRIVGLLAMGLAILDIAVRHEYRVDYRFIGIILWLVYGLLSYSWAIDDTRFHVFYSLYFNNGLMFLLFTMVKFSEYEVLLLKRSVVSGVGALLLYMSFVPDAVIYSSYQHRLTLNAGTEGLDQNYLAALMIVAFGLVVYDLCNNHKLKKHLIIPIIYCSAIIYYIVLTGSRSGLFAVMLIILLNINTSWKTRVFIGIPIILMVVIGVPIISAYLSDDLLERFSISALTGQEAESGTRLIIWKVALSSLSEFRWIVGYGVGASQTIVGNAIGMGNDMAVHNHYIAMLVEVGIIGFLFLNFPIYKMIKKMHTHDKSVAFAMSGIILMAFFLDVVTTKFFWSSLLLLSACCSCRSERKNGKRGD